MSDIFQNTIFLFEKMRQFGKGVATIKNA